MLTLMLTAAAPHAHSQIYCIHHGDHPQKQMLSFDAVTREALHFDKRSGCLHTLQS